MKSFQFYYQSCFRCARKKYHRLQCTHPYLTVGPGRITRSNGFNKPVTGVAVKPLKRSGRRNVRESEVAADRYGRWRVDDGGIRPGYGSINIVPADGDTIYSVNTLFIVFVPIDTGTVYVRFWEYGTIRRQFFICAAKTNMASKRPADSAQASGLIVTGVFFGKRHMRQVSAQTRFGFNIVNNPNCTVDVTCSCVIMLCCGSISAASTQSPQLLNRRSHRNSGSGRYMTSPFNWRRLGWAMVSEIIATKPNRGLVLDSDTRRFTLH